MNYLAVVVATLVSFVLGFIYYSPKLYTGRKWMDLAGTKDLKPEGAAWRLPLGLVADLAKVYVLALAISMTATTTVGGALTIAAGLWLGFVSTVTLGTFLWERKPFGLWVLNNVYNLLAMLIAAAILVLWV